MLCDWHSFVKSRFQSSVIVQIVVWIAAGGRMIRKGKDDTTKPGNIQINTVYHTRPSLAWPMEHPRVMSTDMILCAYRLLIFQIRIKIYWTNFQALT